MTGHFRRVELWSDLECAGGARLAILPRLAVVEPTYDLTGEESLKLRLPRSVDQYPDLVERRALRLVRRAAGVETWEEWRLSGRGESSGFTSPPSDFTGRPVRFDLGDVILRTTLTDGTTAFSFSFIGLTLAEAFDAYLRPALVAAGKGYWNRGTFESSVPFDDAITDATVLSVLRAWADRFGLEMAERRDGTTGYLIDLVAERGATAPMPRVETRKNLELSKRTVTTTEQATRVIPRGGEAGTEKVGIGAIRWTVTAVDTGTKRLTIADELGIVTPIAFDDQLNGWFVFREATGATFAIVDTLAGTQQLELSDVSTFVAGELISLRIADPSTNTLNWRPVIAATGAAPLLYVTSVSSGTNRVTLANSTPAYGGAGAFLAADGDMVDWTAVFCDFVLSSVADTNADAAGFYQVGAGVDLSSVQVGDIAWMDADAAATPPFTQAPVAPIGTVTAVDNVLKRVTVTNRYDATAPAIASTTATGYTLRVYRPATSRVVQASTASANEIELASVASLAAGQLVEVRQAAGGVLPIALEAPVEIQELLSGGYGVIERFVDVPTVRGETNLIPNPFLRIWSGDPDEAPDDWEIAGGATIAQETDPEFQTLGGKSGLVTFGTLYTPAFRVWRIGTSIRATVSLRVRIQFAEFSGTGALTLSIENVAGTPSTRVLRTLYAADHPTAADADKFDVGVWYDIIITAINLAALDLNSPLRLKLTKVGASGTCSAYVDAAQVTQTTYDPGAFIEGSGATQLWNVANQYLAENRQPLVEYAVQLRDLERLDGSSWSADAIVLGGRIHLRDRDLGIIATPRVVQYAPNELDPLSSRVVLSNRQKTLARLLSRLAALAENGIGARSSVPTPAVPTTTDTTDDGGGEGGSGGTGSGTAGLLHVPFFDLLSARGVTKNISDLGAEISPWLETWVLLTGYKSVRLVGYITDPALVSTAVIELLLSLDGGDTFAPLDPESVSMPATTAGPVKSDWIALPLEDQVDVVLNARVAGGGGTATVKLARLAAQFSGVDRSGDGTGTDDTTVSVLLEPSTLALTLGEDEGDVCNSSLSGLEDFGEDFCAYLDEDELRTAYNWAEYS